MSKRRKTMNNVGMFWIRTQSNDLIPVGERDVIEIEHTDGYRYCITVNDGIDPIICAEYSTLNAAKDDFEHLLRFILLNYGGQNTMYLMTRGSDGYDNSETTNTVSDIEFTADESDTETYAGNDNNPDKDFWS
jgi:hypothetical protein